jgi:hypothetical protein
MHKLTKLSQQPREFFVCFILPDMAFCSKWVHCGGVLSAVILRVKICNYIFAPHNNFYAFFIVDNKN